MLQCYHVVTLLLTGGPGRPGGPIAPSTPLVPVSPTSPLIPCGPYQHELEEEASQEINKEREK